MKYLAPVPKQYVDESGIPYSGGTVSVYLHGTPELAEIYSGATGEALIENPCTLDSNGSWQCFVPSGVPLDYIVTDADGNVVSSFIDVVIPEGSGGSSSDMEVVGTPNEILVDRRHQKFVVALSSTIKNAISDLADSVTSVLSALGGKADKVTNAVSGNFAGLNASGNLIDSGAKASDFKQTQTAVSDPTADGDGTSFIDSITQNTNGEITPHKKNVQDGTTSQKGIVQLEDSHASTSTTKAATPNSVKEAYDLANGKQDPITFDGTYDATDNPAATVSTVTTAIADKADKVSGATNGNFAALDGNGNLTNSGKKAADFATSEQGAKADTAYQKPAGGIPKSDLDSGVQASLGKADTALQEHQDISGKANKSEMAITDVSGDATKKNIQLKSGLSQDVVIAHQDISGKVDKVDGKGLSTNDFTDADKEKLDNIEAGAEVNVIETIKVNGTDQTVTDKAVDISVPTASTATPLKDGTASAGSSSQWARGDHRHPTDDSREAVSNKKQVVNDSSTTEYPSSKAVADFVNSSVATNTANFLGTISESSLGLDYTATNEQIALALNVHTWVSAPTNNDYCFVSVNDPQTTDVDEYRRFKFNGSVWAYEYTLNNSSFTQAQWDAINSGLTSSDRTTYNAAVTLLNTHVGDSSIHVTSSEKNAWNAKQDAVSTDTDSSAFGDNTAIATGFSSNKLHLNIASRLWTYIQGKISSVLGLTASSYGGKAATADSVSATVATADNARRVWFSDALDPSKRAYNDNFLYNPVTNMLTTNISGNAATATSATSATTAAGYTNDGAIATALAGKLDTTGDASNTTSTFTKNASDTSSMTSGSKLSVLFTAISDFFASVLSALGEAEYTANKVSSWSSTVNNTHYPSEKLVKDSLDAINSNTTPLIAGTNINITSGSNGVTIGVQDGTTSAKGAVQLSDSVSDTSTTKAATANAVKQAYDAAQGAGSANVVVGASATATANAAATNGNVYINFKDSSGVKTGGSHKITGAGLVSVTSDANGNMTVTGSDPAAITDSEINALFQ